MAETNETTKRAPIDLTLFFHDCLRGLKKSWGLLLVLILALGLFGGVRSARAYRPMYRCQASFTVNTVQAGNENYSYSFYYDQSTAAQMAATFPYILKSDLLTNLLKEDLGVNRINGSPSATSVANSNLFNLTVTSGNPQDALAILEAVIRNYPKVAQYVIGETQLNMIEAPRLPESPYNEREWIGSAVKYGMLGAALYACGLALYALLRNTIRREDEIEQKLRLPCLGVIPVVTFKQRSGKVDKSLSVKNEKTGMSFQEGFRSAALKLAQTLQQSGGKVVGVTAATRAEGSTTVAKNLAMALAETGKRVILIKGDFTLVTKSAKETTKGLEQFFAGECQLADVLERDEKGGIWIAGCKRSLTQQELTAYSDRLKALVAGAKMAVDFVVIDMPAVDELGRAGQELELCDGVVMVIRQDNLKLTRIIDAVEDLSRYDAALLGCVLNMTQEGTGGYGYGGKGYYGRYGHYGRYGSYQRYGGYGTYGETGKS